MSQNFFMCVKTRIYSPPFSIPRHFHFLGRFLQPFLRFPILPFLNRHCQMDSLHCLYGITTDFSSSCLLVSGCFLRPHDFRPLLLLLFLIQLPATQKQLESKMIVRPAYLPNTHFQIIPGNYCLLKSSSHQYG